VRPERGRTAGLDERARTRVFDLRREQLRLEADQLLQCGRTERPALEMRRDGRLGLRRERRLARVGHQLHVHELARSGIVRRRLRVFHVERADAELRRSDVAEVRDGPRSAKHGDRRMRAREPVLGAQVAAGRIADDLDRELGLDHAAVERARRPRQEHADQAAAEQQRVRRGIGHRQIRAVRAVYASEQRIAAAGRVPPGADRVDRNAERVGRLMARDARASVLAERREERLPCRLDRARGTEDPEPSRVVWIGGLGG